ncbi:MAG: hypothetical protein IPN74_05825 [Haliscomenobacter sp.]|nr:hypothetical protein [Haliscomenobacter sp.]
MFYVIADALGNADTCSFKINVADQQPPIARCQPTTLFINPAGDGESGGQRSGNQCR